MQKPELISECDCEVRRCSELQMRKPIAVNTEHMACTSRLAGEPESRKEYKL